MGVCPTLASQTTGLKQLLAMRQWACSCNKETWRLSKANHHLLFKLAERVIPFKKVMTKYSAPGVIYLKEK